MELNPALVKKFITTQTLRRTKTDKTDAIAIARYLMSLDYKPHTEDKIAQIIKDLNPKTLTIRGIGVNSCASIISEFGDFSRFKSSDAILAFAGLDCSIIQSGTASHNGKMVKRGSSHLRCTLMMIAESIFLHEPIFTSYYYKKRGEGKAHRVALSHLTKKLVSIFKTLVLNFAIFIISICFLEHFKYISCK